MRPTVPALVTALVLTLAACTPAASSGGPTPTPTPGPATSAASPTGPGPEDVVATTTIVAGGGELTVEVHPVVRSGEHAVLTLDVVPTARPEDDSALAVDDLFDTEIGVHTTASGGLRLVDLSADQVHTVALDAAGDAVTTLDPSPTIPAEGLRIRSAYAAPAAGTDTIGLLLPGAYLPEVPVIEGDATAGAERPASGTDDREATLDLDAVAEAPVATLETYTRELDGAVSTLTTTEQVQVTLGSDVLFTPDSADLTPEAVAAVGAAVEHLAGRAPGEIDVVGHTDDVADEGHNQDLSERRAEAVAAALADALGERAADYPVRTEGRGEAEPLVANDTDANRALNRRVTLTLTSQVVTEATVRAKGQLPPFDAGPVARGAEGVEVEQGGRSYRVTAPHATRTGGHLVVEVQVTALDQAVDDANGVAFLNGLWSYRGRDVDSPRDAMSLVLLSGATAVYPLDHLAGETAGGRPTWFPLGETDTLRRVDGGQTLTFVAVYPDVEGAESVTLQLGEATGTMPLRLTDVPVKG